MISSIPVAGMLQRQVNLRAPLPNRDWISQAVPRIRTRSTEKWNCIVSRGIASVPSRYLS